MAAMVFFDTLHGGSIRDMACMPEGYMQALGPGGANDPVLQHCRTSSDPLFWDRTTYECAGALDQWHQIRRAGLAYGVCVALHLAIGRHFVLGFDWPASMADQPLPDEAFRLRAKLAVLSYAVHAEPKAFALWSNPQAVPTAMTRGLTEREREVMYWVSSGLADKAIAEELGVSAATVRKHVESAMDKLEASNRTDAAVRAVRLGLARLSGADPGRSVGPTGGASGFGDL